MQEKKRSRANGTYRQFDEAYKRHTVALTLQGTRSVRQIAEELGVTDSMLYEWRRLFAPRPGVDTGAPQTAAEKDEEIRRLRAEVVRMQEWESVLKKSLGMLSETPESGMPKWKR